MRKVSMYLKHSMSAFTRWGSQSRGASLHAAVCMHTSMNEKLFQHWGRVDRSMGVSEEGNSAAIHTGQSVQCSDTPIYVPRCCIAVPRRSRRGHVGYEIHNGRTCGAWHLSCPHVLMSSCPHVLLSSTPTRPHRTAITTSVNGGPECEC